MTKSAITIALAGLLLAAPASQAATTLTVDQGLVPRFSVSQQDYTTRCPAGQVTATLSSSGKSALDGGQAKLGKKIKEIKLRPGQRFTVEVGQRDYSVRCLPEEFVDRQVIGQLPKDTPFLAIGLNRVLDPGKPTFAIVTDRRGVPLWWRQESNPVTDVKFTNRKQIGYWTGKVEEGGLTDGAFKITNPNGRVSRYLRALGSGSDMHEALERKNGNWLLVSGSYQAADMTAFGGLSQDRLFNTDLQEVTPNNKAAFSWRTQDHLAIADTDRWLDTLIAFRGAGNPLDMVHFNSIDEDKNNNLLVSARHHDALYKIDKKSGKIIWKLGGRETEKSLTVIGNKHSPLFGGQHDARFYPGGITVFDNGTGLNRPPRVLRFNINEQKRQATVVEEITNPSVPTSQLAGGARKTAAGNWVVSWAHYSFISSYNKRGQRLFEMNFSRPALSYRAIPAKAGQISRELLLAGMDKQFPRR